MAAEADEPAGSDMPADDFDELDMNISDLIEIRNGSQMNRSGGDPNTVARSATGPEAEEWVDGLRRIARQQIRSEQEERDRLLSVNH